MVQTAKHNTPNSLTTKPQHPHGLTTKTQLPHGIITKTQHPHGLTTKTQHPHGLTTKPQHSHGLTTKKTPSRSDYLATTPQGMTTKQQHPHGMTTKTQHPYGIITKTQHPHGMTTRTQHPNGLPIKTIKPQRSRRLTTEPRQVNTVLLSEETPGTWPRPLAAFLLLPKAVFAKRSVGHRPSARRTTYAVEHKAGRPDFKTFVDLHSPFVSENSYKTGLAVPFVQGSHGLAAGTSRGTGDAKFRLEQSAVVPDGVASSVPSEAL